MRYEEPSSAPEVRVPPATEAGQEWFAIHLIVLVGLIAVALLVAA
jgi:hypothetical protein